MIILSGVLVVVAIALLVAGIVAAERDITELFGMDVLMVFYLSIGVSIVAALCLAIGVFLRRKDLFGSGAAVAHANRARRDPQEKKKSKKEKKAEKAKKSDEPGGDGDAVPGEKPDESRSGAATVVLSAEPSKVPEDASVFVIRGRKRYHLDTCRQLAGRDEEELTYAEAKEEGFSPCTACMPDTALAARAAVPVAAGSERGAEPSGRDGGASASSPVSPAVSSDPSAFRRPEDPAPAEDVARSESPGAEPSASRDDVSEPYASRSFDSEPSRSFDTGSGSSFDSGASSTGSYGGDSGSSESYSGRSYGGDSEAYSSRSFDAEPAASAPIPSAWPTPGATASRPEAAPEPPARPGPVDPLNDPLNVPLDDPLSGPLGRDPLNDPATGDLGAPRPRTPGETPSDTPVASAPGPAPAPPVPSSGDDSTEVRILSGTKRYHRVDCALIEDIGDEADDLESISRAEAKSRGCTPCLVCQPDREHARD
ncbi:hypothetical protein [Actinomadura flavalba]|uniref:hypothetical protein n=1 Tax=Actinomadura flavalba TaxID=1120938 RepID=UPI0003A2817B|nr:hypothetical protein [Actinomadura flavalba]